MSKALCSAQASSKDSKPKYRLQLDLKCYSRFSNSVSKGSTGWWLEDQLASCEPQTHWSLSVWGSPKPWVIYQVLEPLPRFQIHFRRVQLILEPSFIWLAYYLMYYINMKLQLPKYYLFTHHFYCSQAETSYCLQTLHQFKYQHQLALQYFNLYNLC